MSNVTRAPPIKASDRHRFGLRTHLLALVLLLLIPALGLGALVTWQAVAAYRDAFEERLRDTARTLALALDSEIASYVASVQALSSSTALDGSEPDLATFDIQARRAAAQLGTSIILLDASSMRVIINTGLPPGEAENRLSAWDYRTLIETRRPQVTDLFTSAVTMRLAVDVAVPVIREDRIPFVLVARLEPERLSRLIRGAQGVAEGAFAIVVDAKGKLIARSIEHERFAGQPAPEWYMRSVAGQAIGFLRGPNLRGEDVALGFSRIVSVPGWTVSVTEPLRAYVASWRRPLAELVIGGGLILALGAALAFGLARRLLRPVAALAHNARMFAATGTDEALSFPSLPPSGVAEFEDLRLGLAAAGVAAHKRAITKRENDERQALLLREVDHRAKNALAVALALVRLSPRDVPPERFATSVEGRIAAMARAHSLLAHEAWRGAELHAVAEGELAAYAERAKSAGPPAALVAQAVQPMALVLHELATNAAKYGALSNREGRVSLTWDRASEDGALVLHWLESDGPPVLSPPERLGFGTKLIGDLVERQLGGRVKFDWQWNGLHVDVSLPPRYAALSAGNAYAAGGVAENALGTVPRRGVSTAQLRPRVLVVEDEMLLALEAELTLSRLGYEVVGPVHSLIDAVQVAACEINELDAAVLDVNLGGNERSFPLADLLETRGIPYIFTTGYDSVAALAGRDTRAVAVLNKPYASDALAAAIEQALASKLEAR